VPPPDDWEDMDQAIRRRFAELHDELERDVRALESDERQLAGSVLGAAQRQLRDAQAQLDRTQLPTSVLDTAQRQLRSAQVQLARTIRRVEQTAHVRVIHIEEPPRGAAVEPATEAPAAPARSLWERLEDEVEAPPPPGAPKPPEPIAAPATPQVWWRQRATVLATVAILAIALVWAALR
jgi:crotonobetainyl-CoA:carnitine CoA-transferase CaiB-like acyl-CoA transferase